MFSLILVTISLFLFTNTVLGLTYYVQPGDSLYNIAARYGTTVSALQQSNRLWSAAIYPGQALSITSQGAVPASSSSYKVRPGDTLFLLAQRFGVSVDSLKRANNLSGDDLLVGTQLRIPGPGSQSAGNTYVVQNGDTPYLIAKKYGITLAALLQANGLGYGSEIQPGQRLKIPQPASGSGNTSSNSFNLSQSDIDLLARLVTAESGGEPFEGQVAVAATILNRLRDPRYPKTIPGIIYQIDNGCYQYSPVLDGRINLPAESTSYRAVQSALSGWDPSNGANGFYNPAKTDSQWVRSHPISASIGNHIFFSY